MHYYRYSVAAGIFLLLLHTSAIVAQDEEEIGISKPAKLKSVKHQVSIRYNTYERVYGYGVGHYCSGSLISPDIILTAAHCFDNYVANDLNVVMGSLDLINKNKSLAFKIKSITIHPDYEKDKLPNDIAVVYLNNSVPSDSKFIEPIEINRHHVEKGTICQVTGWAYADNTTHELTEPQLLQTADVPVIPECKNTGYEKYKIVEPGMFCAGDIENAGQGPCGGDTGGPLVCNGLLAGIVSFGSRGECQLPTFPVVYAQVDYYQPWIEKQMHQLRALKTDDQDAGTSGSENLSPIVASIVMGVVAAFLRL